MRLHFLALEPRVSVWETKDKKPLDIKICRVVAVGEKSQDHRKICGRDPQGPRMYTNPPTQESALEWHNLLVGSGGSD